MRKVWCNLNSSIVQNVNVMLEQHVTENAEVAITLSRLMEERQRLQLRVKELEEQLNIVAKSKVKISSITLLWYLWKCRINTIKVSDCEWVCVKWIFQKLLVCDQHMLVTQQMNWNNIWQCVQLYHHRHDWSCRRQSQCYVSCTQMMQDLKFSRWCCWWFSFSEISCCVIGYVIRDVPKDCSAFVIRDQKSETIVRFMDCLTLTEKSLWSLFVTDRTALPVTQHHVSEELTCQHTDDVMMLSWSCWWLQFSIWWGCPGYTKCCVFKCCTVMLHIQCWWQLLPHQCGECLLCSTVVH